MKVFGYIFWFIIFIIGLINTFWGNDPFFGLFLVAASIIYLPPFSTWFSKMFFTIPKWLKIGLGIFMLWAALGVAELFDKVNLLLADMGLTL
jgi:hypothetical protein